MVYIVSSIDFKYVVVIDNTLLHLSWISVPASCTNIYRTYIHINNFGVGIIGGCFMPLLTIYQSYVGSQLYFRGRWSILEKTIDFQQLRDQSIN